MIANKGIKAARDMEHGINIVTSTLLDGFSSGFLMFLKIVLTVMVTNQVIVSLAPTTLWLEVKHQKKKISQTHPKWT